MTMYWAEKVVITGNIVIVRDEPYIPEFGAYPEQSKYWGGLLRFHHGPTTKEDTAAGSRYGAGKVVVSGNLLVNELHDQLRGISIEGGRDVFFSGNKIVNGWIRKSGGAKDDIGDGKLSIIGNEFTSDLPVPHGVVGLESGTVEAIVKDNVMRFAAGKAKPTAGRQLAPTEKDEAEAAREEEKLQAPQPAISNLTGAKTMNLLVVEGNVIEGWTGDAMQISAAQRETDPVRFIVRNNSLSGAIRITGLAQSYRSAVTGNIDLKSLEPIQPVIEAHEPPEKVTAPPAAKAVTPTPAAATGAPSEPPAPQ